MKKLFGLLFTFIAIFTLSACAECEECEDCTECTECTECEECEECIDNPQLSFYAEKSYPGSGYTPAYTYYLSGTLDENGVIQSIRYDFVSAFGTSKRSTDYKMNMATFEIGGTSGNQTLSIFVGGSTASIAQVYNTITAELSADGSDLFMAFGVDPSYGAEVAHQDEIFALLAEGLGITIDETTTVADVLTSPAMAYAGLYDSTNNLVKNGRKYIELEGNWGGGNYDHQLAAIEDYAITEELTLEELYTLVSTSNGASDTERDAITGATIMFDDKLIEITRIAAGIEKPADGTVTNTQTVDNNTIYTITVDGVHEITVEVTVNNLGVITAMVVTSHTETSTIGQPVIEGTFIATIIAGQSNLDTVDSVTGATMTSNALLNAAKLALQTYSAN